MKPIPNFFIKNRLVIGVLFLSTIGLFTFQNCTRTFFSMDYQSRFDSLDLSSQAPPVWLNAGKSTNQQIVPVQLNLTQLEEGVQETVVKFRYSFDAALLASKPWEDIQFNFNADLGDLYADDGSKDGSKILFVELQLTRNGVVKLEGSVVLDTLAPQIILFDVAHGATTTTKNFNEAQIKVIDSKTPVSRICLKQKAQSPASNDSCWVSLTSLGVEAHTDIDIENFPYIIGFLRGTYQIYAFVEDEAGNISSVSLSKTIVYNPPIPPVVTDVFVANVNQMSLPPEAGEAKISSNQAFIRWKILTTTPLVNQPVKIYMTTNEKDYQLVQEGLNNAANSGCSIDAKSTGCAALNYNFPSGYFRLRVSVQDQNGQVAVGSSTPLNTEGFQVLAGNTDPGLQGSATAAMFFNYMPTNSYETDPQSLVVTDKGEIIFRDFHRGLLIVEPKDGKIRILMPLGSELTEGSVSNARLNSNRARIALDSSGKILIADQSALRRLDLEKNEIITLIGGGTSLDHETLAREFQFEGCSAGCPIYPLPNGDIYFTTAKDFRVSFGGSARIRKYSAADHKIYSYKPTGVGTIQNHQLEVTHPEYSLDNFIIGFDPVTSQLNFVQLMIGKDVVGGRVFAHATLNPKTFATLPLDEQAPNAFAAMYNSDHYVTDKAGNAFAFSRLEARIKKYNPAQKTWDSLLGTGIQGSCLDATASDSCDVDLQSVFVGLQGYLFFADRGRIRVINENTPFTMAGQAFNFGDNGYAISARFGLIEYLDLDHAGKFKILDPIENRIREFNRRLEIKSIAGNGANLSQSSGAAALDKSIYSSYWGGSSSFVTDPSNGDIFITAGGVITKLDRSNGQWQTVAGGGGHANTDGNGKNGLDVVFQYPPLILGYHSGKLLAATHQWREGYEYGCLINKFETTNNFVQRILMGNAQPCSGDYPAAGAVQTATSVNSSFSNSHLMAQYLPDERLWLGGRTYTGRIVAIKENSDEPTVTRADLPRPIISFTRITTGASQEIFYYCASDSAGYYRIFKYNTSGKTEVALPWPSPTISCSGFKMKYDPSTNTVVFPFRQNQLSGVAEITDLN